MVGILERLEAKKADIKRPPHPPAGHYRFVVSRKHTTRESRDGAWAFLEVPCKALAAQVDVDDRELDDYGASVETINVRHTFIFNQSDDPDAERSNQQTSFQLQNFINLLGIEAEDDESLLSQLDRIEGMEFIGQLTIEPRKDNPEAMNVRISRTLSLAQMGEDIR